MIPLLKCLATTPGKISFLSSGQDNWIVLVFHSYGYIATYNLQYNIVVPPSVVQGFFS